MLTDELSNFFDALMQLRETAQAGSLFDWLSSYQFTIHLTHSLR